MVRKEEKPFGQCIESSGPQFQDCRFLSLCKTRCRSGQFLLRSYSVGHQRCDCFSAPRRAHFFGTFAHGLFVERTSLTSRQRGFGIIDGREKFRTLPFASFPLPQGLTHGIFLAAKPATLDGQLNKGFLVGREKHFHAHSVRAPQASVKRRNVGAPTFSRSAAARRRFAIATRPPNAKSRGGSRASLPPRL
jgi:hypothetical protein